MSRARKPRLGELASARAVAIGNVGDRPSPKHTLVFVGPNGNARPSLRYVRRVGDDMA
jgi:hypothetical protein